MIKMARAINLFSFWDGRQAVTFCLLCLSLFKLNAQVTADFTANRTSGCSPLTVSFTDLSTGNVNSWFWDFGNGNTSRFDDVIATYTNPGTYTVRLTVRDTVNGDIDTRTEVAYITVFADPTADFTQDTTNGCSPLTVNFTDNSIPGDGNLDTWIWDFGDGNLGSGPAPSHTYTDPGTYTVTLVVVDENGCTDNMIQSDIISVSQLANLDFSVSPQTACASPVTMSFTSSVSPANPSYSYLWDFGDGTTSSAPNPFHTYGVNGIYDVTLTLSDASGCQQTLFREDYILIDEPSVDFSVVNPTACAGTLINFVNNSTGADSYLWNFGDGTTSTDANPTHVYGAPGTYTVSLTASNSAGCSDFMAQNNVVTVNAAPTASFTSANNQGCDIPLIVNFTDQSSGNIVGYYWDFGNGQTSNAPNPTATFANPGLYTISLTVTGPNGCQTTETIPDYVRVEPPRANFVPGPVEGCLPLTVNFVDLSTSPVDPIVSWAWSFGDGGVSSLQSPTHTYTLPGQYTVRLTVTTQSGCQDFHLYQFIDVGSRPSVNFDAVPRTACVGEDVNFIDMTAGTGNYWEWNFGDGSGSTDPNPVHTYSDTGTFDISLIVGYNGCRDTLIREDFITINGPIADFIYAPLQACNPPVNVSFFDQSINATNWFWEFGDGNTSDAQNPINRYDKSGVYTINLIIEDSVTGCVDEMTQVITITDPQADFSASATFGCAPMDVSFTDKSTDAISWYWDFGDGSVSTDPNPTHTYNTPGTYTVTQIVSDGLCSDTLTYTNHIRTVGPDPDFTVDAVTGCTPLIVNFSDASTPDAGSTITGWLWDFGDGGTSTNQNPTYSFNQAGLFDISLTVLDSYGCLATETKTSFLQPTFPSVDFTVSDSTACPGSLVSFINQSSGVGLTYTWDFGDGSPTVNTINPNHLYSNSGSYSVTLTATDINGCTDTRVKPGYLNIGNPTANFTADNTSATCPPLTVNFTNQSSSDANSWLWDFGDGSTSTRRNPSKIYTVAGNYDVSLIVTNNFGCSDTLLIDDFIQLSGPTGGFTFSPISGCQPLDVTFNSTSPNPNWTYQWDFGDGTGGVGTTITHTYYTDTTATPIMLVEDDKGCVVPVTSNTNIQIQPLPDPSFTADRTQVCLGELVTFTNTSTSKRSITDFFWDFGDGTTSSVSNPQHTYTDTGTYLVTLRLTTVDGCTDITANPVVITVTTPPSAEFAAIPLEGCIPFPVTFSDSSSSAFPIVDWTWDFGDGTFTTGQTIAPHIYSNEGIYTASLTITDSRGCTSTRNRTITANGLPPVAFDAFRYGCAPITVDFTDQTLGASPAVAWEWNFGDGTTSNLQNPKHIYASNGYYNVSLKVTDANGCENTLMHADFVQLELPIANFTSDAGITCPPQTVNFRDTSLPDTTVTWQWSFGDGSPISTLQNPTHTYYGSDTFDVQLIITNIFGCADTIIQPEHVINYQPPNASFTISDTAACVPENITVSSTSTSNANGVPLTSFLWDFGTGSGSTAPSTSFLYVNPGTYDISLEVTDQNGCKDTAVQQIYIHPNPVADFIAGDTVGCSIATISFTDMSTGANAPVKWEWSFGDGKIGTSQNPTNVYFNDGSYTVGLKVEDINGCRDSIVKPNYIVLQHPNADFSASTVNTCPGTDVQFTDNSTGPFPIVNWRWNFGDGSPVSNQQNPVHAYTNSGNYTVTLIVSDGINCSDTLIRTTYVNVYAGPTADFTYSPPSGCMPLQVQFNDASTAGTASIVSWLWDFGDGTTSVSTNPSHNYPTVGSYTVSLTTTDANGCSDVDSATVQVLQTPTVNFVADQPLGCAPQTINFADQSTSPYTKTSWLWDFGDGTTSNLSGPSHTYANDGVYSVKLVVTDQYGCKDSLTRVNYIRLSHPVADFSWDQAMVCPNEPVGISFTDNSTPDTTLVSWLWDFGDGSTSTLQNPSHSYSSSGTYTVSLTVTNVLGCTDMNTRIALIEVRNAPTPAFTMSDSANCTPLTIAFNDLTTAGDTTVVGWRWDFGNGDVSLLQNPTHTWSTPGLYTVKLTARDLNGCTASDSVQVRAYTLPTADFTSANRLGCAIQDVEFSDLSSGDFNINAWKWYFGDGDSAINIINPIHSYAADGQYDVTLIISDQNGCGDTLTRLNYVKLTHPQAEFSADQTMVCPGVDIQFTDLSIPDTVLTGWLWDFGDGTTSTAQNPLHSYTTPGFYTISLRVTNVLSCSDTEVKTAYIEVLPPPTSSFTPSDTIGCAPFTAVFTDNSVGTASPIITWKWLFGNGDSSSTRNGTVLYKNPGTYTVELTVTDNNGCSASTQRDIQATEGPNANFVTNDSVGCAALVQFSDLTSGDAPITEWYWEFGDGSVDTVQHPTHTYNSSGVYDVRLTVWDANGCTDSLFKPNYINLTRPQAIFGQDQETVCPGTAVTFRDVSIPDFPIVGWFWDFGDGTTSTTRNPVHVYNQVGVHTVTLTITNSKGCTDTETGQVTVLAPPIASFAPSATSGCEPLRVAFIDSSTAFSAGIISWTWDFGNGNSSSIQNPAQTFTTGGTYTVQLYVMDGNGCMDDTAMTITVRPRPQVDFVANPAVGCAPQAINFTSLSSGSNAIVSWAWDFGDGNTSTLENPSNTYLNDGLYTVRLTVEDIYGCTDSLVKTDYIRLRHPQADFSWNPGAGCPGMVVDFTDTSIPDTTLVGWLWDFGDGATSTAQNPSHIYHTPGIYTITLTTTNVLGCSDTETKANIIQVYNQPNAAYLRSDSIGCTPLTVQFVNSSTPSAAPIVSYSWDFQDGSTTTSPNPTHTFTTPGNFDVSLVVTDANACADTATHQVRALPLPVAAFTASDSFGCAPIQINFVDQSLSANGAIVSWLWDFGDGATSTARFPSHTYNADGTYTVSLTVVDVSGCTETIIKPDYIRLNHPLADFDISSNQVCPGTAVLFTDLSVADTTISSWLWDFGDGNTSTAQNPTHFYSNGGVYTISLTVTNIFGCSHNVVKTSYIEVLDGPVAQFQYSSPQACIPFEVTFTDQSTAGSAFIVSWQWDFGDGNSSTLQNPTHTFTLAGTFDVTLTTIDNNGCTSTFTRQLTAFPLPLADFISADSLSCAPANVSFNDLSQSTNTLISWNWEFGDGTFSTNRNPVHNYSMEGTYTVTLRVRDLNGCQDTMVKPNYVRLTNPDPNFSYTPDRGCPGIEVQFTDESVQDTTLVSWLWDFGDGTSSIVQNPQHKYINPGSYTVSLTVTNAIGCQRTETKPNIITVHTPPVADFALADSLSCAPFSIDLTDQSQTVSAPIVKWRWDFGNGDSSLLQEPDYTYMVPGTYQVKLTVEDAFGCSHEYSRELTATSRPTARFQVSDSVGCAPKNIQFTDLSVGDYPISSWIWDFGDGTTSTSYNPSHTYTQDGVYTVSLIIFDDNGCIDTLTKPNLIKLSHPVADFVADQQSGCENSLVSFTDMSQADTTIVAWLWNFGDGGQSAMQNPSHAYTQFGFYDVSLIITNVLGCKDTVVRTNEIEIFEQPSVSFTASDTVGCVPFQVDFEDFSTSPYGIGGREWFLDGQSLGVTASVSHYFTQAGTYEVMLVVRDVNGCTDSLKREIYAGAVPVADFTASDTVGCADATITFRDRSVHTPVQWLWDFGDGATSSQQNPVHTYTQDGIYTVSLEIEDQFGCGSSIVKENYIVLDHPVADFSVIYEPGCPPLPVTFYPTGSGLRGIASWRWDFGDGTKTRSFEDSIVYTYQTSGIYTVSLTAIDSLGCEVEVVQPNLVEVIGDIIPDPVQIHRVSVLNNDQVEVMWESYKDDDFKQYTVYRESGGNGYKPVYTTFVMSDTIFIDKTVQANDSSYCYKVTVTNYCEAESFLSLSLRHCTIELTATPTVDQVILNWTPYIGWPVEQYEIYKVSSYRVGNISFLGVVPGTSTNFSEQLEDCFSDFSYRIKAIGSGEQQISWSDTSMAVSSLGTAGEQVQVIRATVENNEQVLVEWKPVEMDAVSLVYVEKSHNGRPYTIVATLPPGTTNFLDQDVLVNQTSYSYRISAQDSCGNYTPQSNIGKSILLEGEISDNRTFLRWSEYEEWRFDVDYYQIEVLNDTSGNWEVVDRVQSFIQEYTDTKTRFDQPQYCYRIVAYERGGNKTHSVSNEVCLLVETNVYAPNAFTPNYDGVNDEFLLKGLHLQSFNLKIFNRWGVKIFESNNIDIGWDGTYQGQQVEEGVYTYVVKGTGYNGKPYFLSGTVTVLR